MIIRQATLTIQKTSKLLNRLSHDKSELYIANLFKQFLFNKMSHKQKNILFSLCDQQCQHSSADMSTQIRRRLSRKKISTINFSQDKLNKTGKTRMLHLN
jgi:hypothetical protein